MGVYGCVWVCMGTHGWTLKEYKKDVPDYSGASLLVLTSSAGDYCITEKRKKQQQGAKHERN